MANDKTKNAKLLQTLGTTLVAGLLLAGCAKDLPEKAPDNFSRDVHTITKFSSGAIVETTGVGTLALEGENDVERGILALNDGQMYGTKFLSGDATLSKLFEGLKLRASRPGERFKFNFKFTEDKLIAYMETEGHILSEMQEALVTTFQGKKQIPVFSYKVSYGNVEHRKNDLEEETRYIEFKTAEIAGATSVKLTGTKDSRTLSALHGNSDKEKVYSKSKITKKLWTGEEVKNLFQVKATDSKDFDSKVFRTKIVDDKMYFQLPVSKVDLQDEPKALDLLAKGQDPRISACDTDVIAYTKIEKDCVLFPVFEVGVTNVSPKYNIDTKTQVELDTITFESIVSSKAKFVKTDTNSYLTEFNYNADKDQFSFSSLKHSSYSDSKASEILEKLNIKIETLEKINKDNNVDFKTLSVIGTNIGDNHLFIQLPVQKSTLTPVEQLLAQPSKKPMYSECSTEAVRALGLEESSQDCVMKAIYKRSLSYKLHKITFQPDSDLPEIEEIPGTRKSSSFVKVDIDSEHDTNIIRSIGGTRLDTSYFAKDLNKIVHGVENTANYIKAVNVDLKNVIKELNKVGQPTKHLENLTTIKSKIINSSVIFYTPVKRSSLDHIESLLIENGSLGYDSCTKDSAQLANVPESDCIWKPFAKKTGLTFLKHKFEKFANSDYFDFILEGTVRENAEIAYLAKNDYLTKAHDYRDLFGRKLHENALAPDALNKEHLNSVAVDSIIKRMNIRDFKAPKAAKTKVLNDYLWFLEPVKKSALSKLELALAEREINANQRYENCTQDMANAAGIPLQECILKPIMKRVVGYTKVTHIPVAGRDNSAFQFHTAERSDASYMYLATDGYASRFEFDDYTALVKNEVLIDLKKDIDTKKDFLYVPMSLGTPRDVAIADPFFQGQEKIVKFRLIEKGLEVYEPEKDDRFSENELNGKPVLIIPGRYVDFKCSEDDRGNCKGSLSYDSDKNWDEKRFFIPNFEGLQVLEKNTLDLWGLAGNNCVYPVNTAMPKENGYVIKPKTVLNLHLRRTYKTANNMNCLNQLYTELSGLSPMSFKADFYYSIVALDKITTKGYQKVVYPYSDHSTFGFFKGDEKKMDHGHDRQRTEQEYLLHRWNPKLKKLVYYKSETFKLRKNKGRKTCKDYADSKSIANYDDVDYYNEIKCALNKSTDDAVVGMNKSLAMANANFRLDLREPKKGISPGDLRYNMLVLIDDPLDNGLLGYAPTVANPRTGEIVQGHVNMYSGVLAGMSRRVYQGMYRLMINERKAAGTHTTAAAPEAPAEEDSKKITLPPSEAKAAAARAKLIRKLGNKTPAKRLPVNSELKDKMQALKEQLKANDPELIKLAKKNKTFVEDRLNRWAKNNAYPADGYLVSNTLGKKVFKEIKDNKDLFDHNGYLKHYDTLTKRQQMTVAVALIAHSYTSTLVHEFGHNLGLRHNFNGSFDRDNFYSEEERHEHGIEQNPHYSSIMDYGFSELNQLPIFGKYDVAALRFAYAREVELKDGTFAKLEDHNENQPSLRDRGLDLKEYDFCTDENVGTTPKCHRFDEGTSLTEIAKHFRDKFENSYFTSNFRDARRSFNYYSVAYYTSYVNYALKRSRDIFEEYESVEKMFNQYFKNDELENWDILAQGCTGIAKEKLPEWFCTNVNDAMEATKIVGEMLLSIVKTPDAECLLQNAQGQPLMFKLREVYDYMWQHYRENEAPGSCYDPAVVAWLKGVGFTVAGQRGKFVHRIQESNSKYARYASDLSVRGIWPAKLIAMRNLTTRLSGISSTEKGHTSYLEHKDIGPQIYKLMDELATGKPVSNGERFVDINGIDIDEELQFGYTLEYGDDSYIPEQAHPYVIYNFGLPFFEGTQINKQVIKTAYYSTHTVEDEMRDSAKKFMRHISVRKYNMDSSRNSEGFVDQLIDEIIYAATENNVIAKDLIEQYKVAGELDKYGKDLITKVVTQRENPELPSDFTEEQKAMVRVIKAVPLNIITQVLDISRQSPDVLDQGYVNFFVQNFSQEVADDVVKAYTLKADGMSAVMETYALLTNVPPADASDEEKELFKMSLEELKDYLVNGDAKKKVIKTQLENLPRLR